MHADDVFMLERAHDVDLAADLRSKVLLEDLTLIHDFDGEDLTSRFAYSDFDTVK